MNDLQVINKLGKAELDAVRRAIDKGHSKEIQNNG